MFCVVYEFEVNERNENEFKKVWHQLTKIIRENCGGLGSRLHKDTSQSNRWVAYAQWPSKAQWSHHPSFMSAEFSELRKRMQELCIKNQTIYQLEMIDDLLI